MCAEVIPTYTALVARAAMYATAQTMKDRTINLVLESEASGGMRWIFVQQEIFSPCSHVEAPWPNWR